MIAPPAGYEPGDKLWVREMWRTWERPADAVDGVIYQANHEFRAIENTRDAADAWVAAHDNGKHGDSWRPSLFMPRWASRITLEVVSNRVEPLHAIDDVDAVREGVISGVIPADDYGPKRIGYVFGDDDGKCTLYPTERDAFAAAWDHINAGKRRPWSSNPWVWRLEFRMVSP